MTPEEFRKAGHALIDWIAEFRSQLADHPVQSRVGPGEVRAVFPSQPPTEPIDFEQLIAELEQRVVPGLTNMGHPGFHGFFPANAGLASLLGDLASGGLGALGISWQASPALTEVEEVMCDWMRQLVGLSEQWRGTIVDTASTASLLALLCAREKASDYSFEAGGLQGMAAPLTVYTSQYSHFSAGKAAWLAGYGKANLRLVGVEPQTFALDPELLAEAISQDIAEGRRPAAVIATVGTTTSTALDPVRAIVEVAGANGMWVHVDAALAGSAMLLPECRWMWDGIEGVDSISWNPHKWMGTVFDCSLFYVRDPELLVRVMGTQSSYLPGGAAESVTQYRNWGIPLGRRFRALKLWFQLALDGLPAIQARLRRDLVNAQWLRDQIQVTPGWRVLAPVPLQTVCVRHEPERLTGAELDAHTLAWVEAVNRSGKAFLTPAQLDSRWMARVSIGGESTEQSHLEATWAVMQQCATSGLGAS